jgi:hypothetical protein
MASFSSLHQNHPGVGTLPEPNMVTHLGKWWSKVIGLAFGHGLTVDVVEAYAYLMVGDWPQSFHFWF